MGKHNKKITKIGFQGVIGAHADMACRKCFPYLDSFAYPTFDAAMKATEKGEVDLCMIPVENSQAGRVAEIHNLLPETALHIVGEYFQRIEHCLVAIKGADINTIKSVHSHPQALLQCKKNIQKHSFEAVSASNTAVAAKEIAETNDPTKAALCSKLAAEIYGLDILEENFEDADDNTTVFITMAREPWDIDRNEKPLIITSLLFTARNIPAALYKALGGFATNQVNMIKVESYIPSGVSKIAQFFISFEGDPQDENVRLAIEELGFFCKRVKVLGVYAAHQSRIDAMR